MVPRWVAEATQRDHVGAPLGPLADKLDGTSPVVEAVPAIEVEDAPETDGFNPFGRGDVRMWSITADDALLLTEQAQPLRIIVPVTVDG